MIPEFPDRLKRYATGYFGEEGEAWLEALPDILTRCCEKWGLTLGPISAEIKANYVGFATLPNGKEVVLKVGVPKFVQPEMDMLALYDGRGINRMIDHDRKLSAMLLERFTPGTMLVEMDDSREQARIAGRIARDLHRTPPPENPSFKHAADRLNKTISIVSESTDPERARPYRVQLDRLKAMVDGPLAKEPQILLHGDLHHYNILLDESRGWTAIDPQCEIGASCLEFGSFVGNAGGDEPTIEEERETIVEAIQMLSETSGESEERVYAGAFFDYMVWTSRRLKDPPDDDEARKLEEFGVFVEIGRDVDLERIGSC